MHSKFGTQRGTSCFERGDGDRSGWIQPLAQYALRYAAMGLYVFPAVPGDKVPLIKEWQHRATTDPREITGWWSRWPTANIAFACEPSDLVVIDDDMTEAFETTIDSLTDHIIYDILYETVIAFTPSPGRHFYFRAASYKIKSAIGVLPNIDIRALGGYVIAPPSLHPCGKRYAWNLFRALGKTKVAPMTEELAEIFDRNITRRPKSTIAGGRMAFPYDKLFMKLPRYLTPLNDREEHKIFCPFHGDGRFPSFNVNRVTGLWYCFGRCQRGGNATQIEEWLWLNRKNLRRRFQP